VPWLAVLWLSALVGCAQDRDEAQRAEMVRTQIEARGVKDPETLRAMRETPRALCMPEAVRPQAYEDRPVPIGYGQTISQPYIVGLMTSLLHAEKRHKVLEIGTGSGYQAAVLSELAGRVFTMEIVPQLARSAEGTLKKLGYANVAVRLGDGYRGWPEQAPFDRIILTAAPPEVPKTLLNQLAPGGRLVAPEGGAILGQELVVIEKSMDGKLKKRNVRPVAFVPMVRGESLPARR